MITYGGIVYIIQTWEETDCAPRMRGNRDDDIVLGDVKYPDYIAYYYFGQVFH